MRSDGDGPIRRLRGVRRTSVSPDVAAVSDLPAAVLIAVVEPESEPEPVFMCDGCRRDLPLSERSRVNRDRCRACI
jgi:hypothetical protein